MLLSSIFKLSSQNDHTTGDSIGKIYGDFPAPWVKGIAVTPKAQGHPFVEISLSPWEIVTGFDLNSLCI